MSFYSNSDGSDVFVERTTQSWFGRIGNAFGAILFGVILVIGAAILLFWNEGRAARTAAALAEGAGLVVSVETGAVDAAHEGKLIHLAGATTLGGPAEDADFRFPAEALKLDRKVQMYQWKEDSHSETHKYAGGSQETVTTYTYARVWSDKAIDSGRFRRQSDHRNPAFPNVTSRAFYPPGARLGAFHVDANVLSKLSATEPFTAPYSALAGARSALGSRARLSSGGIYAGADPDRPEIGDVRATWSVAPVGDVSVVGAQAGDAVSPFVASNGEEVLLVESGDVDAKLMFKHGEDRNRILAWILRAAGVLTMFLGFRVSMTLIETLADVVPLFGAIVGAGGWLAAFFCTLALAPLVIAIAWFFYRPLIALAVLVVGAALAYGLHAHARRRVASLA